MFVSDMSPIWPAQIKNSRNGPAHFRNSWNGPAPNQEFLKRAGPNQELPKVYSSPPVCKNYRACVNVFSGTSLDSWILNCIRELLTLAVQVISGSNCFSQSYTQRHLLVSFFNPSHNSWFGLAHFGNSWIGLARFRNFWFLLLHLREKQFFLECFTYFLPLLMDLSPPHAYKGFQVCKTNDPIELF